MGQDYVAAHQWANIAATDGNEAAVKMRDNLSKLMTREQIADAQKKAREWIAKTRDKG